MNNTIIKGDSMSVLNGGTTRRRLSLLASSSLVLAGLTALGGAALAPSTALAANECAVVGVEPSANGQTPDTYACSGSYSATGVTYSSAGDLTVNATGAMNVGTVGVNLTANTTDVVTFTATGVVTGTADPVIDVSSATGATGTLNITTTGVTGTNVNVTHGIQAVSTTGAAISVTNTAGNVNINSNTAGALQQTAIRAVSTGGSGAVSVTTAGTVTGRLRGIQAQSSGTSALTVTATGAVSVNTTAGVGVAAIDARSGTGLLTVNIGTGTGSIHGQTGAAILTNAGGDAIIDIASGRTVQAVATTAGALNLTAVGSTTVNNSGTITVTPTGLAIDAAGAGFTLANAGALTGRIDLASVTGVSSVTNSGAWTFTGANDFGAGAGALTNSGTLSVGGASSLTGLETFNNSGTVMLGAATLAAPGASFTGSGSSLLRISTALAPSDACGAEGSGCLDLTGGTTAGVTRIAVTVDGTLPTAFTPGVVLVDVAGGTSAAGRFVLDTGSSGYVVDPTLGAVLATDGLFAFQLSYDQAARQHRLVSIPGRDAFEFTPIIHEALSAWHTTADLVAGRQADLGSGANGGMWVRAVAEHSDRDLVQGYAVDANAYSFDTGYSLETGTAVIGFDLVNGQDATFGVHAGLVKSKLAFEGSGTRDELTGPTVGLYGGWRSGPFSLDGTLNANMLELERSAPTYEDVVTNVVSIGGRAEAAWTLAAGGAFHLQPLVAAAYVVSNFEDARPTGQDITFEDAVSARAAVGLRAVGDLGPLGLWAVARAWKEFAGDGSVSIRNTGTATGVTFADDLSGDFQEIGAGMSLSNEADTLQGYASTGAKLAEGIDNYTVSLGVRLRW